MNFPYFGKQLQWHKEEKKNLGGFWTLSVAIQLAAIKP